MATKFWQGATILLSIASVFISHGSAVAEPPTTVHPQLASVPQAASYWILTEKNSTRLVANQVSFNSQHPTGQVLAVAFSQLLENTDFASQHSAIPLNTKLLSLKVQPTGVYVDLSSEFLRGGGSSSMIHRLTQVVYTATSLNPDALVYLSVDGQVLDDRNPLAGEGLMVRYPVSRQQLAKDFPLR